MAKEITREEQYLKAILSGNTSKMPDKPLTRVEALLEAIALKPSGGGGGGDMEHMTKAEMLAILRGDE